MSSSPPELSWAQVHAFRLERHHLMRRAAKNDLARVVGEIGGLQAQVMSAAELQAAVRVDCGVEDVRDALWQRKTLAKTWLMRGTLHLVPAEDLPLYTAAMRARWMSLRNSWLKYVQLTEPEFWEVVEAIGHALDGQVLTREELIAKVGKGRSERIREVMKSGWGGILKPVARSGLLCFGPSRGQSVTFVRPQQWLGAWREVDPDQALVEVARRYLRAYGPATKQDFTRWWGSWSGVGNAAWAGLAGELVGVTIEGKRADLLSADVNLISKQRVEESIQLLPLFDPYLMGHSSRDHIVDAANLSKVSRTAGWISAVVLVDGKVAGTWKHASSDGGIRITVEPFRRLSAKTTAGVRRQAESMAGALGLAKAEVRFA
ncbi:MAG TPA: winged helix DNA-binding domain-containing protein [Candidatus Dormibacteraeota bacterium]|nr:winged helix DNA-binding domain-containing protein [Candidatus Dormibacteraeota bacterium]